MQPRDVFQCDVTFQSEVVLRNVVNQLLDKIKQIHTT